MVLDIDLFRADKGGDPEKMRENQKLRYKDVKLVDLIVEKDNQWRQCKYNVHEKHVFLMLFLFLLSFFLLYHSTIPIGSAKQVEEFCQQGDW